jgi:hypothetical protein
MILVELWLTCHCRLSLVADGRYCRTGVIAQQKTCCRTNWHGYIDYLYCSDAIGDSLLHAEPARNQTLLIHVVSQLPLSNDQSHKHGCNDGYDNVSPMVTV